jgi:uncharacterized protein YkwD
MNGRKAPESIPRIPARILGVPLLALALATTSFAASPTVSAATRPAEQVRWLTNHSRLERGLDQLHSNPRLSRIAARHSRSMAARGVLFHSRNVPHLLRTWQWSRWGENVGMTNSPLSALQWAFMNSPEHRRNILGRRFARVGIGVAEVDGVSWVTVIFYG